MTAEQRAKICKRMLWIIPGTEDLKPYITAKDKKKKWTMGTVGMALIAANLRDHGRNSAIINIKKENAYERLRSII